MPDPPSYPGSKAEDDTRAPAERAPISARSRWTSILIVILVIAIFAVIIVLHVTGTLGSNMHG